MNTKLLVFLCLFSGIIITSDIGCKKKDTTTPPATPAPTGPAATDVKILGHKGAGSNNYEDLYMEMTTPCFIEALRTCDGVEIDAQMSLDGTIWMYHNSEIDQSCTWPSYYTPALYNLHDSTISQIQLCADGRQDRIYKMSELISLWNSTPGGFYMDIEIKQDDLDQDTVIVYCGGMETYLARMAHSFDSLFVTRNNPDNRILFEVDDTNFRHIIKTDYPGFKFILFRYGFTSLNDYADSAVALGYDGITEDFDNSYVNATSVAYVKSKGLIVELWTPYTSAELTSCFNMNPDFIQTDNMNAKKDLNIQ